MEFAFFYVKVLGGIWIFDVKVPGGVLFNTGNDLQQRHSRPRCKHSHCWSGAWCWRMMIMMVVVKKNDDDLITQDAQLRPSKMCTSSHTGTSASGQCSSDNKLKYSADKRIFSRQNIDMFRGQIVKAFSRQNIKIFSRQKFKHLHHDDDQNFQHLLRPGLQLWHWKQTGTLRGEIFRSFDNWSFCRIL